MRNYLKITCFSFLLLFSTGTCFAVSSLLPSTPYTVELHQMNSNGTTTLSSTSSATSDANSKISFDFSNVPTSPTFNFLIIKVIDSSGTVVTKSFAPAPPVAGTNSLGVNTVSTSQADLLEKLGVKMGSDDPMAMSFGLMITRRPNMSASDVDNFAIIGQEAIITGMQSYMLTNGVTPAQMTTFKKALVYNGATDSTDLRAFSLLYKNAIDGPNTATDDMAKAAGLVSDIFIDAAAVSSIDLNVILSAFDSAGLSLESGAGGAAMASLSTAFMASMIQSVDGFKNRLKAFKVKQSYSEVLTALSASTAEQTQFSNAVTTMSTAMALIDTVYGPCFDGTIALDTGSVAGSSGACVAANINKAYETTFLAFSTDIASTNTDITTLLTAIESALANGTTVQNLRDGQIGTYYGFDNLPRNWPVPQTASVKFIADVIIANGDLTYTRLALAIPLNMKEWLGTCANSAIYNKADCLGAQSSWVADTTVPAVTSVGNPSFDALLEIQADVQIAESTRFDIYSPGKPAVTSQIEQTAKEEFIANLAIIASKIGGTIDGATAFTTIQKKALIIGQQQPSLD